MNMSIRVLLVLLLGLSVGISAADRTYVETQKDKILLDLVLQGLRVNHYQETRIDDAFSERIYTLYLKNLDYGKRFFTQKDIETLALYKYQLDDQTKAGSLEFMVLASDILKERIEQSKVYTEAILAKPMNFEKIEDYQTDPEKRMYASSEKTREDYWRQYLKHQVLYRLADKLEEQEKAKEDNDTSVTIKPFEELEKEVRKKVLETHEDWFKRLDRQEHDDYRSGYLNAITAAFDPHTNYFPPKDKENFDISMSGKLEGIGAQLREEGSYIKVVNIVPGSPSWKQGDLKAGDIILKVAQGKEEPVDVVDMPVDDAVQIIRGKKGTEVRLTVKKLDGSIKVIPIVRDVVVLEETYAKSAIIKKDEHKQQVGYISLPKFYADFNKTGGRNSGEDVRKEVLKLKEEGIDGLIIDLRGNGGGSLQDVVDMAGLFIKSGPIVQVKPREGDPYVLTDNDPSLIYDGPLVILVNEFSASASEILAAAMQDYNRALVIGSQATFGKGTVQRFFDLDNFVTPDMNSIKPLGVVKLTTQKFYRVNGQTTQLKGVTPDIVLPDAYSMIQVGEQEEEYPLGWDETKAAYYKEFDNPWDFEAVEKKSLQRIKNDQMFNLALENAVRLKEQRDDTEVSLHLGIYQDEQEKRKEEATKYDVFDEEIADLQVMALKEQQELFKTDTAKKERIEAWHKNIRKDIYVDEALCVIKDMVDMPDNSISKVKD